MSENDSADFVDDIVQDSVPQHTAPPREDFMPWHKVRKQFIRNRQWNEATSRIVKRFLSSRLQDEPTLWAIDIDGPDVPEAPESVILEKSLRCLVIPGDDLLDIRSLWTQIRPLRCYIRYLGFNERHGSSQEGTRIHIANNAVTAMDRVARDSTVLADRFQSVGNHNTLAYRYLKEYGPYHVVNLDFCDTLFPTKGLDLSPHYTALHSLADYQMKQQTTPWLLFVTTQVEPGMLDAGELWRLCGPAKNNHGKYQEFASRVDALISSGVLDAKSPDFTQMSEEAITRVFGVALGKWFIHLATTAQPDWVVRMLKSYKYQIKQTPKVEMFSFAFLFSPKHSSPTDPTGLSKFSGAPRNFESELESALRVVTMVDKIDDVDALLAADASLHASLEAESADLMEIAGFNRAKYLDWVNSGEAVEVVGE